MREFDCIHCGGVVNAPSPADSRGFCRGDVYVVTCSECKRGIRLTVHVAPYFTTECERAEDHTPKLIAHRWSCSKCSAVLSKAH